MKNLCLFFAFCLLLNCLLPLSIRAYEFDTKPCDTTIEAYLEWLGFEKTYVETTNKPATAIDISEDGLLVISKADWGFGDNHAIDVYDNNGTFLYGYNYEESASSTYPLAWWSGKELNISPTGRDLIITLDENGNGISLVEVDFSTVAGARKYRAFRDQAYSKVRNRDDAEYCMKVEIFGYFGKVVKHNENGDELTIHNVTGSLLTRYIVGAVLILSAIVAAVLTFVIGAKRQYRKNRTDEQIGASELRETARMFMKENINGAKISCSLFPGEDILAEFNRECYKMLSDEYIKNAVFLLTDDIFDRLECAEADVRMLPMTYGIVDGYWATANVAISIPDDYGDAHIDGVTFYFDSEKNLKMARIIIYKNNIGYMCDLTVQ